MCIVSMLAKSLADMQSSWTCVAMGAQVDRTLRTLARLHVEGIVLDNQFE